MKIELIEVIHIIYIYITCTLSFKIVVLYILLIYTIYYFSGILSYYILILLSILFFLGIT